MPVLKREKIEFPQSNGETHWLREVHVSSFGSFTIKLPPDVATALNHDEVRADTLQGVLKLWDKAIRTYSKARPATRKVILYDFAAAGHFARRKAGGHFTGIGRVGDRSGLAIALHAEVFNEVKTINGDGKWEYRYDRVASSIPDSACFPYEPNREQRKYRDQLDWTAAREAFFAKMAIAMENVIEDFETLFRDDDKLTSIADKGGQTFRLTR